MSRLLCASANTASARLRICLRLCLLRHLRRVLQSQADPTSDAASLAVVAALIQIVIAEALIEAHALGTVQNVTLQNTTTDDVLLEDEGTLARLNRVLDSSRLVYNAVIGIALFVIALAMVYAWLTYSFLKEKEPKSMTAAMIEADAKVREEADAKVTKRRSELHEQATRERNNAFKDLGKARKGYAGAAQGIQRSLSSVRSPKKQQDGSTSPKEQPEEEKLEEVDSEEDVDLEEEKQEKPKPKHEQPKSGEPTGRGSICPGICRGVGYSMKAVCTAVVVATFHDFIGTRFIGKINTWLCCSMMCCVPQAKITPGGIEEWLDVRFCFHLNDRLGNHSSTTIRFVRSFLRLYVLGGVIFAIAISPHSQELIAGTFVSLYIVVVIL